MSAGDGVRNAERTRQKILGAARSVLAERGTATSVQEIATAAGVSKSGLLHHFASKDVLLRAVVEDYLQHVHRRVMAHVDLAENRPGKVLRAYVRALCGPDPGVRELYANLADIGRYLSEVPGVEDLFDADNARWRELFAADGLNADRILVAQYAAEGLAMATGYHELARTEDLARALPLLLSLTDDDGPLAPPADA